MIERWREKLHRLRRMDGVDGVDVDGNGNGNGNDSITNNDVRLRSSSSVAMNVNRSKHKRRTNTKTVVHGAVRNVSLALLCVCAISHQIRSERYTANAFSLFSPESITSTLPSSSARPEQHSATTALFLFSLKNDNNGEDDATNTENDNDDERTTATIEKTAGWDAEEESEDFSAWMEGLKRGTPLGKMAASPSSPARIASEEDNDSDSVVGTLDSTAATTKTPISSSSSTTTSNVNSVSLRDSKSKADSSSTTSSSSNSSNSSSSSSNNSSSSSSSIENTGRRKINPLSNLIQFEAMLELAKIAGTKDGTSDKTDSSSNSSATDVFAVVDRLVKTFQKQEEDKQKGRKELLQLAQLEKKIKTEDKRLVRDKNNNNDSNSNNNSGDSIDGDTTYIEGVSATTTVKELMELDRYVGGLPFPKVNNIWDTFSGKGGSVATIDDGVSEDDTTNDNADGKDDSIPSTGLASSSPLFRGKEPNDADDVTSSSTSTNMAQAAESILKDTTNKMEYLVAEASSAILEPSDDGSTSSSSSTSTSTLQDLVGRASSVFNNTATSPSSSTTTAPNTATTTTGTIVESISNDIVSTAQKIAKESGVEINVQFAADRAREATEFAVGVAATANMVLDAGYAYGSRSGSSFISTTSGDGSQVAEANRPPLFGDFASAQRIENYEFDNVVFQGAEMGVLAGAIYEDPLERCHQLGHSLVANGTTANVAWMVTDSVMDREHYTSAFRHHEDDALSKTGDGSEDSSEDAPSGPVMIRTITMRGFDASDESVDREALLNEICFATAEPMDDTTADRVVFHKGLLNIAREMYAEMKQYIDWTSPNHKIVLNGHSVGGSLSVLMLLLIASERGADYVRDHIPRAYSHGCPPVATLVNKTIAQYSANEKFGGTQSCPILEAFDLPPSMIYGYIQPYDPVIRLFSNRDVLYPLVDDLGKDGVTLYSTGPIRSLRPITRAIFQAWDGWPQFRDNWKGTCDMQYHSVGIQHILLPEPLRYLNDRFISVNVGVPPVDTIVRISPEDLLPALDLTFPLDTFQVSLVPQAVRSFLHHFYPAYDASISDYAKKAKNEEKVDVGKKSGAFKPFQTTQS